jgi:hypothetical protein
MKVRGKTSSYQYNKKGEKIAPPIFRHETIQITTNFM